MRFAAPLVALSCLLAACVSVGVGENVPVQALYLLHDAHAAAPRRSAPLVAALLIQPLPADAMADTQSIAYSRRSQEFAFYQFASWTERPLRQLPRLLQRRLEARGVAGAVGMLGEPLNADTLLTMAVDALYHDVAASPGQARFALTAELFDRRSRVRLAQRSFAVSVPVASADSAAATTALSQAVTQSFDELLPWLEDALQRLPQPKAVP